MTSQQIVSDLSSVLSRYARSSGTFRSDLSEVMARYYDDGLFKDMVAKVSVAPSGTTNGVLNLPPGYLALLGVSAHQGAPLPIYPQSHEWQELAIGFVEPNEMTQVGVIDMGDGYPTTVDLSAESTLRFKIYNAADAGKTVRLYGRGTQNGKTDQEIYDTSGNKGWQATTANPTVDFSQTFSSLLPPEGALTLPSNMVGMSELYSVVGGVETLLGRYQPGDTRPSYRRYKFGVTDQAIIGFCSLRFSPYRANSDPVKPCNTGAIKFGLQALIQEDALQFDKASILWAKGKALWNAQLKAMRGASKPRFFISGKELQTGPSWVS